MWWLAAPNIQFACSAKVKIMPQRVKKTHNNVHLPQVKANGVGKQPCAVK
jgi:hypothetical protein